MTDQSTWLKKGTLLRQDSECHGVPVIPGATLMVVDDQSYDDEVRVAYLSPHPGAKDSPFRDQTIDSGYYFYIDPAHCTKL
jgi:hypothetical protein